MKRKFTFTMALILILILLTGTAAVAASYRGVSWFLTDDTCEPHYLVKPLRRYHTSHRLIVNVVDAYWDGTDLSVAYRIQSFDPDDIVAMRCMHPSHEHYDLQAHARIIVEQPPYVIITEGETTRHTTGYEIKWVTEDDGSLTVMIAFQETALSDQLDFTIPLINVRNGSNPETAYLHFQLPSLPDPIDNHMHDWMPATCVSPKVCTVCSRVEGGLGAHTYIEATCTTLSTCSICGTTKGTLSLHHLYDTNGICTECGKIKK